MGNEGEMIKSKNIEYHCLERTILLFLFCYLDIVI